MRDCSGGDGPCILGWPDMSSQTRYVVWRQGRGGTSIGTVLSEFPAIKVLRLTDPDHAVVLMDEATRDQVRVRRPDLMIERDSQYRAVSAL
jgi:hypothetical protein